MKFCLRGIGMGKTTIIGALAAMALALPAGGAEKDTRQKFTMPEPVARHMKSIMRDHLLAVHDVLFLLSHNELKLAADTAEQRLGLSSVAPLGAHHVNSYFPKQARGISLQMNRAASRFAEVARSGDLTQAVAAMSKVTEQCAACHFGYRLQVQRTGAPE